MELGQMHQHVKNQENKLKSKGAKSECQEKKTKRKILGKINKRIEKIEAIEVGDAKHPALAYVAANE